MALHGQPSGCRYQPGLLVSRAKECTFLRCTSPAVHDGRCMRHPAKVWQRVEGTTTQRGYGYAWQKLRAKILKRDGYVCQCDDCKKLDRVLAASEVDHIVSKAAGGTDSPDNLQAINSECHKRKTARDSGYKPRYGCDSSGMPLDPDHHWREGGGQKVKSFYPY
jgi:5-methylcytosine-specific restriction protein A